MPQDNPFGGDIIMPPDGLCLYHCVNHALSNGTPTRGASATLEATTAMSNEDTHNGGHVGKHGHIDRLGCADNDAIRLCPRGLDDRDNAVEIVLRAASDRVSKRPR